MTVKASELAESLLLYPDREVVISRTVTNNHGSYCEAFGTAAFVPNGRFDGEVMMEPHELTTEMRSKGYTDESIAPAGYVPVVVLYPTM